MINKKNEDTIGVKHAQKLQKSSDPNDLHFVKILFNINFATWNRSIYLSIVLLQLENLFIKKRSGDKK